MDTQLFCHPIGDGELRQGISENQALKHATIFRLFDLTLKDLFNKTCIAVGGGGAVAKARKEILATFKPTDSRAQQTHYIRRLSSMGVYVFVAKDPKRGPGNKFHKEVDVQED